MSDQLCTDITKALKHVEDTSGQTGLGKGLRQFQGAQRGDFRGFEDHGIAANECGSRLPAGDLDRIVPGADAETDAERFALGVGEGAAQIDMFAGKRCGQTTEVFQAVGAGRSIGNQGFLQGLAGVERFQNGEFPVLFTQDLGRPAQHAAAFGCWCCRPDLLAFLGRADCRLDHRIVGRADLRDDFTGCGIQRVKGSAALALDI